MLLAEARWAGWLAGLGWLGWAGWAGLGTARRCMHGSTKCLVAAPTSRSLLPAPCPISFRVEAGTPTREQGL